MILKIIKKNKVVLVIVMLIILSVILGQRFNNQKVTAKELLGKEINEITTRELITYINEKNELLNSLAQKDGARIEKSRIIFSQFLTANELKDLTRKYNLPVKELHIGWAEHRGGFTPQDGQTIEQIINDASKSHLEFLQAVISSEKDAKLLGSFREYYNAFQKNGLTVFGFDTEAPISTLKKIKDENQYVRLADIDPQGRGQFLVPVSPYDFINLK